MCDFISIVESLMEAPISDVEVRGDLSKLGLTFDDGTGFDRVDRGIIKSPKARAKLFRAFSRTPHNFEIIFANSVDINGDDPQDNEEVDSLARRMKAGVHDEYGPIKGKLGVIRFVLMGNLSPVAEKMPLTPWTVAHKIGHAIQDEFSRNRVWNDIALTPFQEAVAKINFQLNDIPPVIWNSGLTADELRRHRRPRYDDSKGTNTSKTAFNYPLSLYKTMTMKSARDGKLENPFEQFAEVIAQYLVRGRAHFNFYGGDPDDPEAKQVVERLNAAIKHLFELLEGKVLVEV